MKRTNINVIGEGRVRKCVSVSVFKEYLHKGREREKTKKAGHTRTEVETGVKLHNQEEYLEPPEARKGEKGFSAMVFRGSVALTIPLCWSFGLQIYKRTHFCCLKSVSLRKFVMAIVKSE